MTYKVTYQPAGIIVDVDPARYPCSRTGRPGSLLDIAVAHGVTIEHACGGGGICGTCHVEVLEGAGNLSPADEREQDLIDGVPGSTLHTRIGCLAVVQGNVTVQLPKT